MTTTHLLTVSTICATRWRRASSMTSSESWPGPTTQRRHSDENQLNGRRWLRLNKPRANFFAWLLGQWHRQDEVGALVRHLDEIGQHTGRRLPRSVMGIHGALLSNGCHDSHFAALFSAQNEYQKRRTA